MMHQSKAGLRDHGSWRVVVVLILGILLVACVSAPAASARPRGAATLKINSGALFTSKTAVTLNSSVSSCTEMRFRDGGGVYTAWEPYATTRAWALPIGDGLKQVQVQYNRSTGKSLTLSASITLDTVAPTLIGPVEPTNPVQADWFTADSVILSWPVATDSSGITGYSWVLDANPATQPDISVESASPTASFSGLSDGVWYVHVRATDRAGNGSVTLHRMIRVDTTAPGTTDNTDGLPHSDFVLALSPADATSGVALTQYRVDGGQWTAGTTVTLQLKYRHRRFGLSRGAHTVEYRSTDIAGNVETVKSCSVVLGS